MIFTDEGLKVRQQVLKTVITTCTANRVVTDAFFKREPGVALMSVQQLCYPPVPPQDVIKGPAIQAETERHR